MSGTALVGWGFVVLGAHLIGSVPFSYLVAKLAASRDVRTVGSHNVGATNVFRAAGKGAAVAAGLLDGGKGVAAVLFARSFDGRPVVIGAAAVAAVLGHVAPIFLGFRGGKGGATGLGALAVMAPLPTMGSALVFLSAVAWKRYVSLGTISAAVAAPLLVLIGQKTGWVTSDPWVAVASIAIALIILVCHIGNLKRLVAGTEPKLGRRS